MRKAGHEFVQYYECLSRTTYTEEKGVVVMREGMHQSVNLYDVVTFQQNVAGAHLPGLVVSADDLYLIEQLRRGEEAAFVSLIDRYATSMLHLAMVYVKAWTVAEDVDQ